MVDIGSLHLVASYLYRLGTGLKRESVGTQLYTIDTMERAPEQILLTIINPIKLKLRMQIGSASPSATMGNQSLPMCVPLSLFRSSPQKQRVRASVFPSLAKSLSSKEVRSNCWTHQCQPTTRVSAFRYKHRNYLTCNDYKSKMTPRFMSKKPLLPLPTCMPVVLASPVNSLVVTW